MSRRLLISCIVLTFFAFFSVTKMEEVNAACNYPAFCDPGGTTCNGGLPCYIGNDVCVRTGTPSCTCVGAKDEYGNDQNLGCSAGQSGYACGGGNGGTPGLCQCTYPSCSDWQCTDTHWPTCGGGGTCGWGNWGACTVACGGGTRSRVNSCNGNVQTETCNTQACPVPTPSPGQPPASPVVCNWGSWSNCSQACGGGTRSRTDNCGNTQTESCNTQECPCTVGAWSACSASCGSGFRSRTNNCASGGIEYEACDTCTLGCACGVACGQSTACGTCSNTELGTPGVITLNPQSGNLQLPSNRSITLNWSSSARADEYDIQVYPTGTTPGQECTAANTFCATGLTTTSYTFTAPQGVPNYSWRVRPNNTTCNAVTYLTATASDEWLTSEGAPYNMVAANAVNGTDATAWNAGGYPTHWIELDLKGTRTISGIRMATNHSPNGNATYQIYAGSSPNPTTLVDSITQFITTGDVLNVTFSSPVANVRYIRIVTTSSTSWVGWNELTPYYSDGVAAWTNGTFTLVGPISGNIYLDQDFNAALNLATGLCEISSSPTGQNPGVGSTVGATWQSGGSAGGNITGDSYVINNVLNYNNIGVQLNPDASTWRCTCPFGCTYSGQNIPESGINFFIANVAQPWWQTQNGLVYAGTTTGNALVSLIPDTCVGPSCLANFSYRNSLDASESSGIAITGGGDIDTDPDPVARYSRLREEVNQGHVIGSVYNGPRENYQYFYNLYSMGSSPASDFNGIKPTTAPTNGRSYYGAGNITINTPWTVASGESLVIFVNGNLNIENTITVDEGGFLAFIVSGNVTVANTVGNSIATDMTPNVSGVYIADRIIIEGGLAGGDLKFIGSGTFVGWTSVTLGREYDDPFTNDNYPTELFIFRPDFVKNVPERMTRPIYSWQETN